MDRKELKTRIQNWDTQMWKEVLHKPILRWYKEAKLYIGTATITAKSQTSLILLVAPIRLG